MTDKPRRCGHVDGSFGGQQCDETTYSNYLNGPLCDLHAPTQPERQPVAINIDGDDLAVSYAKWEAAKLAADQAKTALDDAADELRAKLLEQAPSGADLVHADGRAAAKWTRKTQTVKDVAGLARANLVAFTACAKPADFDAAQLKKLYPDLHARFVAVVPSETYELRLA